jgi:5-hydroxyisourate hydrolase
MGKLTTHVLDTANGCPGNQIDITLFAVTDGVPRQLVQTCTNHDGRCDAPLLDGELTPGIYELHFDAGGYFARLGTELPVPPFVETVVLRFGIADPAAHYHVPLLVSPWSYSTYRGS